ncbi:hypothetical protein HYH02_001340 [Chlamydomonas schloesseri]|uniref:Uncharacterized protein n=1 Tax=Chlamydomonas schloesseri TaxID=2026947 RepID=A0A836BCB2_9CHLO|nr:hypothetical protein HYH02_001340 [Chlamydomonas schloesseri]|eukprot:KAG2454312.1 hypothetical protein HYH02_001340 [Chlamydomonas schloesseri]
MPSQAVSVPTDTLTSAGSLTALFPGAQQVNVTGETLSVPVQVTATAAIDATTATATASFVSSRTGQVVNVSVGCNAGFLEAFRSELVARANVSDEVLANVTCSSGGGSGGGGGSTTSGTGSGATATNVTGRRSLRSGAKSKRRGARSPAALDAPRDQQPQPRLPAASATLSSDYYDYEGVYAARDAPAAGADLAAGSGTYVAPTGRELLQSTTPNTSASTSSSGGTANGMCPAPGSGNSSTSLQLVAVLRLPAAELNNTDFYKARLRQTLDAWAAEAAAGNGTAGGLLLCGPASDSDITATTQVTVSREVALTAAGTSALAGVCGSSSFTATNMLGGAGSAVACQVVLAATSAAEPPPPQGGITQASPNSEAAATPPAAGKAGVPLAIIIATAVVGALVSAAACAIAAVVVARRRKRKREEQEPGVSVKHLQLTPAAAQRPGSAPPASGNEDFWVSWQPMPVPPALAGAAAAAAAAGAGGDGNQLLAPGTDAVAAAADTDAQREGVVSPLGVVAYFLPHDEAGRSLAEPIEEDLEEEERARLSANSAGAAAVAATGAAAALAAGSGSVARAGGGAAAGSAQDGVRASASHQPTSRRSFAALMENAFRKALSLTPRPGSASGGADTARSTAQSSGGGGGSGRMSHDVALRQYAGGGAAAAAGAGATGSAAGALGGINPGALDSGDSLRRRASWTTMMEGGIGTLRPPASRAPSRDGDVNVFARNATGSAEPLALLAPPAAGSPGAAADSHSAPGEAGAGTHTASRHALGGGGAGVLAYRFLAGSRRVRPGRGWEDSGGSGALGSPSAASSRSSLTGVGPGPVSGGSSSAAGGGGGGGGTTAAAAAVPAVNVIGPSNYKSPSQFRLAGGSSNSLPTPVVSVRRVSEGLGNPAAAGSPPRSPGPGVMAGRWSVTPPGTEPASIGVVSASALEDLRPEPAGRAGHSRNNSSGIGWTSIRRDNGAGDGLAALAGSVSDYGTGSNKSAPLPRVVGGVNPYAIARSVLVSPGGGGRPSSDFVLLPVTSAAATAPGTGPEAAASAAAGSPRAQQRDPAAAPSPVVVRSGAGVLVSPVRRGTLHAGGGGGGGGGAASASGVVLSPAGPHGAVGDWDEEPPLEPLMPPPPPALHHVAVQPTGRASHDAAAVAPPERAVVGVSTLLAKLPYTATRGGAAPSSLSSPAALARAGTDVAAVAAGLGNKAAPLKTATMVGGRRNLLAGGGGSSSSSGQAAETAPYARQASPGTAAVASGAASRAEPVLQSPSGVHRGPSSALLRPAAPGAAFAASPPQPAAARSPQAAALPPRHSEPHASAQALASAVPGGAEEGPGGWFLPGRGPPRAGASPSPGRPPRAAPAHPASAPEGATRASVGSGDGPPYGAAPLGSQQSPGRSGAGISPVAGRGLNRRVSEAQAAALAGPATHRAPQHAVSDAGLVYHHSPLQPQQYQQQQYQQ